MTKEKERDKNGVTLFWLKGNAPSKLFGLVQEQIKK